jgi:hypothetical protein
MLTSIITRKKELRDYEDLLDFARVELIEDQQKLIRMRNTEAAAFELKELEDEIEILNKAVDRYQNKVKVLKNAIQESENQS